MKCRPWIGKWHLHDARVETTESRGSVEVCWTAIETGKEEVTEKIMTVKGETGKLEQGMTEIIRETQELEIITNARIRRERRIT